ncbi:MAG: hypothetical protein RXP97_00485 [Nitrososphaeria archaeon]|jgi:thymidylate kinase
MTSACEVGSAELGALLSAVEGRDPSAVRIAAAIGGPLGAELSLAASLALSAGPGTGRRGPFIVITGIDKAGKETHIFNPARIPGIKPLVDLLGEIGYHPLGVRQPEYGFLSGQLIRSYLGLDAACRISGTLSPDTAWILWSLNRALVNPSVEFWLSRERGAVISKRWSESNLAYHAAQGVSPERILALESGFSRPDLFVVLDIDPEEAARRIGGDGDLFESRRQLLSDAREMFMELDRYFPGSAVISVDAAGDPVAVNGYLVDRIRAFLRR